MGGVLFIRLRMLTVEVADIIVIVIIIITNINIVIIWYSALCSLETGISFCDNLT